MAAPILCNGPDGGPAAVLITMTADGDTVGLCGPCLTDWCHALLRATAPDLLAPEPAKPKRATRRKQPEPIPIAAIIDEHGHDTGDTPIGDKLIKGDHDTA